ncbi:hypothetical protein C8F01DRAFT_1107393 [Mycena amicta]|nr:hypothetical protein C8F01DRAFT_1107393 [Mycena amicta]
MALLCLSQTQILGLIGIALEHASNRRMISATFLYRTFHRSVCLDAPSRLHVLQLQRMRTVIKGLVHIIAASSSKPHIHMFAPRTAYWAIRGYHHHELIVLPLDVTGKRIDNIRWQESGGRSKQEVQLPNNMVTANVRYPMAQALHKVSRVWHDEPVWAGSFCSRATELSKHKPISEPEHIYSKLLRWLFHLTSGSSTSGSRVPQRRMPQST